MASSNAAGFGAPVGAARFVGLVDHPKHGQNRVLAGQGQRPDRAVDGAVLDHATSCGGQWFTGCSRVVHRCWVAYERQGRHRAPCVTSVRCVSRASRAASAASRRPRSLAGNASGSPRPRIAITSAVQGPIPGNASNCLRARSQSLPLSSDDAAVGEAGDQCAQRPLPGLGDRQSGRDRSRRVARPTGRCGSTRRSGSAIGCP